MATTDHQPPPVTIHDLPRAQRFLMLEFGSRDEWDDPRLEYRRLFSEVLGTFMLVLAAAGGGILHAKGEISLAAAVVAPGLDGDGDYPVHGRYLRRAPEPGRVTGIRVPG